MSKYSPTVNPGDSRLRIYRTQGENPNIDGVYNKYFFEERVVLIKEGDDLVEKSVEKTATIPLDYEPGKKLTLRNPETDEVVGESDYDTALMYEYSLARQAQEERDQGI